jgi:hypothetical protein
MSVIFHAGVTLLAAFGSIFSAQVVNEEIAKSRRKKA